MDGHPRSVWGKGWSLHVHRRQMPRMGIPHHELWYFQVPPGPIPVEPRCHLRPNEVSKEKSLSTPDSGGTCLRRSPRAATCHSTTLLFKNVPIFTGNRESQEYVPLHSCRALLARFHRGLRGSHSLSLYYSNASRSPSACP